MVWKGKAAVAAAEREARREVRERQDAEADAAAEAQESSRREILVAATRDLGAALVGCVDHTAATAPEPGSPDIIITPENQDEEDRLATLFQECTRLRDWLLPYAHTPHASPASQQCADMAARCGTLRITCARSCGDLPWARALMQSVTNTTGGQMRRTRWHYKNCLRWSSRRSLSAVRQALRRTRTLQSRVAWACTRSA